MPVVRLRRGSALIEAIVALTVLATAGLSIVILARQSAVQVLTAYEREAAVRDASNFLDAAFLWTRDDLNRRLGNREQGPWDMEIIRITRTIYAVSLLDSASGRIVVRTALFRPESTLTGVDAR